MRHVEQHVEQRKLLKNIASNKKHVEPSYREIIRGIFTPGFDVFDVFDVTKQSTYVV